MPRMIALVAAALACAACGTSSSSSNPPWHGTLVVTSVVAANVTACSVTETITLNHTDAMPSSVTVPGDGCVRFVNDDTEAHQPASDPHPIHNCLTTLNPAGSPPGTSPILMAGESFTSPPLGAGLAAPKTCGWHDNLNPPVMSGGGGGGY